MPSQTPIVTIKRKSAEISFTENIPHALYLRTALCEGSLGKIEFNCGLSAMTLVIDVIDKKKIKRQFVCNLSDLIESILANKDQKPSA